MTIASPGFELEHVGFDRIVVRLDPDREWSGESQWADPEAALVQLAPVLLAALKPYEGLKATEENLEAVRGAVHLALLKLVKEWRLWKGLSGWEIGARS